MAEALCNASDRGDLAEMARLIDAGAALDALGAWHGTALTSHGTALAAAARHGQLAAVRLLLDRGAGPNQTNSAGDTPLMSAVAHGDVAVVRELATRGADLDTVQPETGGTAFHLACVSSQPDCVAALVELGCDMTIKTKDGRTGKQWAVQNGGEEVLRRLEEATQRRRALEAERAAAARREEVGRLIARQAFGAAAPLLARMLRDAPADPELLAWRAEVAAAQAEAEAVAEANAAALLAELEAEGSSGGSVGQSKSQKKKEKQRRRKEAAKAAAAAVDGVPKLEPEPEPQMAAECDADEQPSPPAEAQPTQVTAAALGGKRRKKNSKKQGPRPGPAAGPLEIIEPGQPELAAGYEPDQPAPEPEPEADEPEPEADEPEPEADEPELEQLLSASAQQLIAMKAVPMAEWSEEQVLAWAELVELEPETRAALRAVFGAEDIDGEDLATLLPKRLLKMLKRAGLQGDLPAAAEAVLAARDALRVHSSPPRRGATAEDAVAKGAPSCQICFEPYDEAVVPRMLTCGHTFCEPCLSKMLRCAGSSTN
jgi:hypothetical protein